MFLSQHNSSFRAQHDSSDDEPLQQSARKSARKVVKEKPPGTYAEDTGDEDSSV